MWYTLCCIFAPEIKKKVATSVGNLLNDYVNEAKKVKGER